MHVCFLNMPIEYYSPICGGAISTIIMQTARQLLQSGHEVSVLTQLGQDETYPVGAIVPIQPKTREQLHLIQRGFSRIRGAFNQWDFPYFEYYKASFCKALRQVSPPDAVILFND